MVRQHAPLRDEIVRKERYCSIARLIPCKIARKVHLDFWFA